MRLDNTRATNDELETVSSVITPDDRIEPSLMLIAEKHVISQPYLRSNFDKLDLKITLFAGPEDSLSVR